MDGGIFYSGTVRSRDVSSTNPSGIFSYVASDGMANLMMFSFRLNSDPGLICSAYEARNNRRWSLRPDESFVPNPNVTYVEVWLGNSFLGCFTFFDTDRPQTIQVHTTLLPSAYGMASRIGDELIEWLGGQDKYDTLQTMCLPTNRPIFRLILSVGFKLVGQVQAEWDGHLELFDKYEIPIPKRSEQMNKLEQTGGIGCQ